MGQSLALEALSAPQGSPERLSGNHAANEAYQFSLSQPFTNNTVEQLPSGELAIPPLDYGTGSFPPGQSGSSRLPNFVDSGLSLGDGTPTNELPKFLSDGTATGKTALSGDQQTAVSTIEQQYQKSEQSTEKDLQKQEKTLQGEMLQDDLGLGLKQTEQAIAKDESTLNHDFRSEDSQLWSVLTPEQQGKLQSAMDQQEKKSAFPKQSGGWPNLGPLGV